MGEGGDDITLIYARVLWSCSPTRCKFMVSSARRFSPHLGDLSLPTAGLPLPVLCSANFILNPLTREKDSGCSTAWCDQHNTYGTTNVYEIVEHVFKTVLNKCNNYFCVYAMIWWCHEMRNLCSCVDYCHPLPLFLSSFSLPKQVSWVRSNSH